MNPFEMKARVDHPDIVEVFADDGKIMMTSDGVMSVALGASRIDGLQPRSAPTGKTHTATRLAKTNPVKRDANGT